MNKLLEAYLNKRMDEPTVILCFRILLDNAIKKGSDARMTKSEIEKVFNAEHKKFGVQTFRRDYVMRQSSNKNNAIDQVDEKFFIRDEYFESTDEKELKSISKKINEIYENVTKQRQEFVKSIESILGKSQSTKYAFILDLLTVAETDRRGQNFEITSFAILKTFYEARGFELNRFSTIYANDGGIDFAAQNAIYQVTTQMNDRKLLEDLDKAPLKKRIFVYRDVTASFNPDLFNHDLIIDHIGIRELIDHLDYLNVKNSERHLDRIIKVILEEYNREYYVS